MESPSTQTFEHKLKNKIQFVNRRSFVDFQSKVSKQFIYSSAGAIIKFSDKRSDVATCNLIRLCHASNEAYLRDLS